MSTSAPEKVTNALLSVQDVHADVAGQPVLQGLSLDVREGEFVAVLGHNGAGKSTLLRALLGLTPTKSGSIHLRGEDITSASTPRIVDSGVALVPQQRGYFENLSVNDNLSFGERGSGRITRADVLEMFPILQTRGDQLVGTMSGGQRQMVAISIALMSSPDLLMLDEPSVGLQPNLVDTVMQVAQRLNAEYGMTVILVEQNIEKVLQVAKRVAVINRGRIMLDQPVEKVTADEIWRLL
ncbi:ABC transporter ATP-binding protein [Kribbia dieselivorans]|uniref:ABC transporter ATP-binding protein n=1 Tax=Kribbia dieselivorans TaxID=331526 RepID=UPI0008397B5A|nr:ABC transporter ATP-binding protein [Kribbia dieselivorans]